MTVLKVAFVFLPGLNINIHRLRSWLPALDALTSYASCGVCLPTAHVVEVELSLRSNMLVTAFSALLLRVHSNPACFFVVPVEKSH